MNEDVKKTEQAYGSLAALYLSPELEELRCESS